MSGSHPDGISRPGSVLLHLHLLPGKNGAQTRRKIKRVKATA